MCLVTAAANLLEITEKEVFFRAYREWSGNKDENVPAIAFRQYITHVVNGTYPTLPLFVQWYCRDVLELEAHTEPLLIDIVFPVRYLLRHFFKQAAS